MRNGMPDRVPLRPLAAEITAKYAGFTCQEVTHDYRKAFEAVIRCCRDFAWDAAVPNMVYVWTGLTQAIGLRYYGVPGIDVGPDVAFQYREPSEDGAFMKREEYDELIADPTRFLYETWLPRVSSEVSAKGQPASYRNNLSFVKGGMAMLELLPRLRTAGGAHAHECGTPSAICGMLKAPLDILADKLRGYLGLAFDLMEIPEKVLAACEALMPHLGYLALTGADPHKQFPFPSGCIAAARRLFPGEHFETIYWPTLRPIVDALWAQGNQVLFYAEGKWDAHLETLSPNFPRGSIIYHLDRSDPALAHRILGKKFCLSGGVPNTLLAFGTPEEVKAHCRRLIETIGAEGGYIMDASAIIQNDATLENLRGHDRRHARIRRVPFALVAVREAGAGRRPGQFPEWATAPKSSPACASRGRRSRGIAADQGDPDMVRRVWNDIEGLAYLYIWHVLLSF